MAQAMRDLLFAWVLIGGGLVSIVVLTMGSGSAFERWNEENADYVKNSVWVTLIFIWPVLFIAILIALYQRVRGKNEY